MDDFSFDCMKVVSMGGKRLDALETFVHSQVRVVLAGTPLNKAPEPTTDDLSWQIEGWSD